MEVLRTLAGRLFGALRAAGPVTIRSPSWASSARCCVLVTEFSTIVAVDVLTSGTCREIADPAVTEACQTSGIEQHGGAFLLLVLLALLMTAGAGRGGSRPGGRRAGGHRRGGPGLRLRARPAQDPEGGPGGPGYNDAKAGPGSGLYTEITGGALLVLAGAIGLVRPRPARDDCAAASSAAAPRTDPVERRRRVGTRPDAVDVPSIDRLGPHRGESPSPGTGPPACVRRSARRRDRRSAPVSGARSEAMQGRRRGEALLPAGERGRVTQQSDAYRAADYQR